MLRYGKWAVLCVAILAGCGGKKEEDPVQPGPDGSPGWVRMGGEAFPDGGEVFYGVGTVSGVHNEALARQAADERARIEVSRQLETQVTAMMEDYMQSIADFVSDSAEEQAIRSTGRTITDQTLVGCRIIDRWTAPNGTCYACAKLSMTALAGQMTQQMTQVVQQRISRNREQALDRLDDAIDRSRNRFRESAGGGNANGRTPDKGGRSGQHQEDAQ